MANDKTMGDLVQGTYAYDMLPDGTEVFDAGTYMVVVRQNNIVTEKCEMDTYRDLIKNNNSHNELSKLRQELQESKEKIKQCEQRIQQISQTLWGKSSISTITDSEHEQVCRLFAEIASTFAKLSAHSMSNIPIESLLTVYSNIPIESWDEHEVLSPNANEALRKLGLEVSKSSSMKKYLWNLADPKRVLFPFRIIDRIGHAVLKKQTRAAFNIPITDTDTRDALKALGFMIYIENGVMYCDV